MKTDAIQSAMQAMDAVQAQLDGQKAVGGSVVGGEGLGDSFADGLADAIESVDAHQHKADASLELLMRGEGNAAQTMVALSEADITLRTMSSVRDKVVAAYEQIMNMAI
ncbi:MAG TPA: flagellar hook-basal body complex protein FliE [Myxococcota bacterium]|nr:flagellar hook-basal body complex protein FliE [Myxococcota bacterium]